MIASLYQSSSVAISASGTSLAFSFSAGWRPSAIAGKTPSARRGISAREASTFSAFLFTVMPLPLEGRPHFLTGKGDALHPNKKPWVGQWFRWNRFSWPALITSYLLPVFGQFRDYSLTVACKQRAE